MSVFKEKPPTTTSMKPPLFETKCQLVIGPTFKDWAPNRVFYIWIGRVNIQVEQIRCMHLHGRTADSTLERSASSCSVIKHFLTKPIDVWLPSSRTRRVVHRPYLVSATSQHFGDWSCDVRITLPGCPGIQLGNPQLLGVNFGNIWVGNYIFKLLDHLHLCVRVIVVQSSPVYAFRRVKNS